VLADFNELLKGKPIGVVYANRGCVYQRLHDYQRSIDDLTDALRLDPSLSLAHKWRGVSYFNIHENELRLPISTQRSGSIPRTTKSTGRARRPMKPRATSRPRSPISPNISIASPSRCAAMSGARKSSSRWAIPVARLSTAATQ
jgi:Tetratricopeptide repeat